MKFLRRLFGPSALQKRAEQLYTETVLQARNPILYTEFGVPDTLDGRFEALVLHLFITLEKLRKHDESEELIRLVQEVFFRDMDRALREMGVSDTGVGKRVKKMASAFYGQVSAYRQAASHDEMFRNTLKRNLYATLSDPIDEGKVKRLSDYVNQALTESAANRPLA